MGYYSDAALALTAKAISILKKKLSHEQPQLSEDVKSLLSNATAHYVDEKTKAEFWAWRSIKWYEFDPRYFPEIQFMTELLTDLEEEDYRFIRIGEDYDDTEAKGLFTENPFDLELAREIKYQA